MNPSCEPVRESLSALMDREWPTLTRDQVTTHLTGCPDCRHWQHRAAGATRIAAGSAPQPPADLTAGLVAALAALPRRTPWTVAVRVLLALTGWGIAAFAVPALVYGLDAEAPPHVAHEMGSLNVAIGLTLILAAIRPRHAIGVLPLLAAMVGLLALTAGDDILRGHTTWTHEAPHALVVAGLVLVAALHRLQRPRPTRPAPPDRQPAPTTLHRRPSGQGTDRQQAPRRRAI